MSHKIDSPLRMRDGSVAEDPRLGRLPQFDERSKGYNVADILDQQDLVIEDKFWTVHITLDQGQTSACTGNSRTYDLASNPVPVNNIDGHPLDEQFAQKVYEEAKRQDEWSGEDYEGSSVLGAFKALKVMGMEGKYHFAFNIDDMVTALATIGPVNVGTTWFNSMFDPDPVTGLIDIDPDSGEAGGHAYLFHAVYFSQHQQEQRAGEYRPNDSLMEFKNSWGLSWGKKGHGHMWASDYEDYLMKGADQAVVTEPFQWKAA